MTIRLGTIGKLFLLVLSFAAVFCGRLWYGYRTTPDEPRVVRAGGPGVAISDDEYDAVRSFARDGDRYYERIAIMTASTRSFDADLRSLKSAIGSAGAVILYERDVLRSDISTRAAALAVAVKPSEFEKLCSAMRGVGKTESSHIVRTDVTDEHKTIEAQRDQLEATRKSLLETRRQRRTSADAAEVQRRLDEIDRDLREIAGRVARFSDGGRETVRITLFEDRDVVVAPPTREHRAMVALKWTAKYWGVGVAAFALFSLGLFLCAAAFARIADTVAPRGRHAQTSSDGPAMKELGTGTEIADDNVEHHIERGDDNRDERNDEK